MDESRSRNIVGAMTLALADSISEATQDSAFERGPAAAALTLIGHTPGISIGALAGAVDLTHAGAVRLVNRLESEGLVERRLHTLDARTRALHLTEAGKTACDSVLAARDEALSRGLAVLTPEEQNLLSKLAERMLRSMLKDEPHADQTCRLCNHQQCASCPVDDELSCRIRTLR